MPCQYLVDLLPGPQDFLGVNVHVGGLPLETAQRLMDHDPRMRQRVALAGRAGRQQQRPHARRLPDAQGADVGTAELHRVVHRKPGADRPPGGIDVQGDVLVRVLRLQEQDLRHHQVGHVVVDAAHDEDHPLLEQARIDVVRALAARALLHHHGDVLGLDVRHRPVRSPSCSSVMRSFFTVACSSTQRMITSQVASRSRCPRTSGFRRALRRAAAGSLNCPA